jgi:hypothetical protein
MAKFPTGTSADVGDTVPADYWKKAGELLNSGGTFYNVRNPDFGAVGDGTNDDTAEIQACIDASAVGDVIVFPPGIYGISAPIVRKPFRTYTGLGPGWLDQTVIKALNGSSANFQSTSGHSGLMVPESWNTNATVASGPEVVQHLAFNGNKANNATGQHHGLVIYGEYWGKYRNIRSFDNRRCGISMLTTAKNGVATMAAGLSDSQFENIWVNQNEEHGFWQDTPVSNHTDVVWSGSNRFFDNVLSGIWCDNPAGWEFNNLHLSNNGQHSCYFQDASFSVKINGFYSENHGITAAAGIPYFGLRAGINNGEPLEVVNATIRVLEPAGTSNFYCIALEGLESDAHAYLTNVHCMGAGTARGHGLNYNAASTRKLTVHESGVGAVGFAAGQDMEIIGSGVVALDPPRAMTGTAAWTPGAIGANAGATQSVTVTGAALGDVVAVGYNQNLQDGLVLTGEVSAANTVTAQIRNVTAGSLTPTAGTVRATAWKH